MKLSDIIDDKYLCAWQIVLNVAIIIIIIIIIFNKLIKDEKNVNLKEKRGKCWRWL